MPERSNGSGLGPDSLVLTEVQILFPAFVCARSSAWIERFPPKEEAEGSNPSGRVKQ